MPTTSLGLRYPSSTDDVRPYEDIQFLASDTDDTFVDRTPLYARGKLSGNQSLTTTITDLAGCSVTINVPTAQAVAWISFAMDCRLITAGSTSTLAVLNVVVDGVTLTDPQPVWGPGNQSAQPNTRGVAACPGVPVLLSGAGNHTIKAQGAMASTGSIQAAASHTYVNVLVLPY